MALDEARAEYFMAAACGPWSRERESFKNTGARSTIQYVTRPSDQAQV
jgi:hypothetical protein